MGRKWNPALYEDVCPIDCELADGPLPLAVIEVSAHFKEVHGLLYALIERNEVSDRVYRLTDEVIRLNSASYTAWDWRRRCFPIEELEFEMEFTADWIQSSPKNYQVWYHRRWLIDNHCRDNIESEQLFLSSILELDAKNYNCFSHRVFLFDLSTKLDCDLETLVSAEIAFTTTLIDKDIRNNSAWSYRRHAWKQGMSYDIVADEIRFTLDRISLAPHNESAWIYLRSLNGWQAFPNIFETASQFTSNRFAVQTLLELAIYHKQTAEIRRLLTLLETHVDPLRSNYWRFVAKSLSL